MFRLFIWSWFKSVFCICLENCPFHPDFSVLLSIRLCGRIWWISTVSIIMSHFSFLILFIWILFLCPLVSLPKSLSILLIWSKNQLMVLLLCIVLFFSTWLISDLSFRISFCLFLLGVFASFCSRFSRCVVNLLVYALSSLFLKALKAVSFTLSSAFKFWYVVPSFSLNSNESFISLFLPWTSYHLV